MTPAISASIAQPRRALNITLWIAQTLLALAFGAAGLMKLAHPESGLEVGIPFLALVRFIGVAELAGALGLLLPALSRIQPRLTALAALGLLVVMLLASAFHLTRGEVSKLPVTLVLGALAAFVVWGRARAVPIAPRDR